MLDQPTNDSRYAMLALARSDAQDLAEGERAVEQMDPIRFNEWVGQFVNDPPQLRTAAPVEVAVLLRMVDAHPGWVTDPIVYRRLQAAIPEQLGDFETDVVRGSRAHAVDTIRQAQNPTLADFRAGVLRALDRAHHDIARDGGTIQTAFASRLAEQGLIVTDPELGEPFERISTPSTRIPNPARIVADQPGLWDQRPSMLGPRR